MHSPLYPPFAPRAPWYGPDLQTLRNFVRGAAVAPTEPILFERLELPLADGSGDVLLARLARPQEGRAPRRSDAPLVVLVHGLGGSEESPYIGATTSHLLAGGWPVLQLNLRGAGPSRARCRQQYHAGRSEDFRDALLGLPEPLTANGIVAVGYSLGGNMLLKYAAEYAGLRGVVSISAPIDLAAASQRFLDPRNRVYHLRLLIGMKAEALGEGAAITEEERHLLPGIRSILEFDEKIVAPRNGFAGAADYYAKNHARQFLGAIRLPALVIHAQDDPWIPKQAYTSYDWSSNGILTALLPTGGGHVGFHGRGTHVPWHDRCLVRFLQLI
jgi:predicted alpha/beta-fold hydrolase